ncbi:putative tRNA-splicing endonuclease [Phialemonium atrogriseum]|uniref:tRNA-intron lyase n=1 Tax=Phialemonium atrogriseum TaxID=1093897 RepID=A0AAJ0BY00_9PEZI|nr:putative tRNA-splicing endonuclease [Phialemonium atrogriseum]KAK1766351.1 putative tRNA-splicing endonuclease [Phialemonium atrogriseum]
MSKTASTPGEVIPQAGPPKPRSIPPHQLHVLPAPIRTFPLPAFYPSNPVSLLHLVYAWLKHTISPPPAEPSTVHKGTWDPKTRSVHITDPASMRAMWEQGFYGKGSLSRSEPNWLKREQIRRGVAAGNVSEEYTASRREQRRVVKWERARIEQEAIERTRFEEALSAAEDQKLIPTGHPQRKPPLRLPPPKPPVGPLELLALPNSIADLHDAQGNAGTHSMHVQEPGATSVNGTLLPPPALERDAVPHHDEPRHSNGVNHLETDKSGAHPNDHAGMNGPANGTLNGSLSPLSPCVAKDGSKSSPPGKESEEQQPLKHRKSVRFSPRVESTTFQLSDPPNPNHSAALPQNSTARDVNGVASESTNSPSDADEVITNKEHLQLSPEEAFFLVFAIGALTVVDGATNSPIPPEQLFTLFRSYSHFPPRISGSSVGDLQPQDPFLVHYAVYHHFRSLGFVPRHGIKFGVDWLLYQRGPVFDHAEFGLIVIPSFSDPWWKEHGHHPPKKSWQWLHGVNRVLSHVLKSLVIVYVDIPPPPAFDEAMASRDGNGGIAAALKKYRIREIMVRRWSSNRNR